MIKDIKVFVLKTLILKMEGNWQLNLVPKELGIWDTKKNI